MCPKRLLLVLTALGATVSPPSPALANLEHRPPAFATSSGSLTWLRVDPLHPTTLFVGGTTAIAFTYLTRQGWVNRSVDGGDTFQDLSGNMGFRAVPYGYNEPGVVDLDPVVIAPDGRHIYADFRYESGDAQLRLDPSGLLRSEDAGLHWEQGGAGGAGLFVSPVSSSRLYVLSVEDNIADVGEPYRRDTLAAVSSDGGKSFKPLKLLDASSLVPDPSRVDTVYANGGGGTLDVRDATGAYTTTVTGSFGPLRSDDAGATWTAVITPTATPALQTFVLGTDPHEPGMLVGRTQDRGVQADRIWLSRDQGRTWRAALCPGAWHGQCPSQTVDNVFGAGHSYAFFGDGIHRFDGSGPSGDLLPISGSLPAPPAAVISAAAGRKRGDPIYLLAQGSTATMQGLLFRSRDGGKTWRELSSEALPTADPPSTGPGTIYVRATKHSVGAPFAATYRKLGFQIVGFPITETYYEGDVLTQDFQRLELQILGGKVVVGSLGLEYMVREDSVQDSTEGHRSVPPDLARFWQQHGGLAVFGKPISDIYRAQNGDGSGRTYAMMDFERARLERHPEVSDPQYAIQVGLLGDQVLFDRGWLT